MVTVRGMLLNQLITPLATPEALSCALICLVGTPNPLKLLILPIALLLSLIVELAFPLNCFVGAGNPLKVPTALMAVFDAACVEDASD